MGEQRLTYLVSCLEPFGWVISILKQIETHTFKVAANDNNK